MLNMIEIMELIYNRPEDLLHTKTDKSGHLYFKCKELKKIVFKINPNRRTLYIRKPGPTQTYVNMGCLVSTEQAKSLIQNAINMNRRKR